MAAEMKIGFISDTHGAYDVWQKCYAAYLHDCKYIFHAGDILYHGPRNPLPGGYNPAALAEELNNIPNTILFAHGNCDAEVDNMVLLHPIQTPYLLADIRGKRIVMAHGHYFASAAEITAVAERFKADLFVYGHIHLPVLEKVNETLYLNPGSPTLPKNENKRGTLALWEENSLRIIYTDNGETCFEVKF